MRQPERLRILGATAQTERGPVALRRHDSIPDDLLPGERERLDYAIEPVPGPYAAVDIFTTQPHYFDHVAPVSRALQAPIQCPEGLARRRGHLAPTAPYNGSHAVRNHDTALVMGPADIRTAVRFGWKRIAYLCHGIGQDYNRLLSAAAPGENIPWDKVDVVLLPSYFAEKRFQPLCPAAEKIVVGQPKLDELSALPHPQTRTAALSFRWSHQRAPEAKGAIDHYRDGLAQVAAYAAAHGIDLLGHGHPRIFGNLKTVYSNAGIEPVADFADVVRRAGVYACDNSSTLFEFAALDRPVVVMNAPWYRRTVNHGGRFWDWADVGEQVDSPAALAQAIARAFDDPTAESRRRVVAEVLPRADGRAAERAAEALVERFPAEPRPATAQPLQGHRAAATMAL